MKEIRKLNTGKAAQSTDIIVKFFKLNNDIIVAYICDFFNECIDTGQFSSILKQADMTTVFKKRFKGSKENYRPVSIFQVISKIFEKLICKQITSFID